LSFCPPFARATGLKLGRLEPTNKYFAIAKIEGTKFYRAYAHEYGKNLFQ